MSIFRKKVIELADQFKDWKNDAVRRLLEKGQYTERDIDELADMVLYHNDLIKELTVRPKRIGQSQIYLQEERKKHRVILKEVSSPKNVNSLSPEANLHFSASGLTVVFGENGSGKSGFSRILKKCCRAKDPGNVLGNIYDKKSNVPAEATILYSCAGEDQAPLRWVDGEYRGSELENILVHDSKCGIIQVNDHSEIFYLPNGGDILPALAVCLGEVEKRVKGKMSREDLPDFGVAKDTKAQQVINAMTSKTTEKEISEQLCFTENNNKKLLELKQRIDNADEDNMKKKLETLNREEENIQELCNFLKSYEKYFLKNKIEAACQLVENKNKLSVALETQNMQFITGTYSSLWISMYEAAQNFVEEIAHADHTHLTVDNKCVLCQQTIDEKTKNRMKIFFEFFEKSLKKKLDEISDQIDSRSNMLDKLENKIAYCLGLMKLNFSYVLEKQRKKLIDHFMSLNKTRILVADVLKNNKKPEKEILFCESKLVLVEEVAEKIEKEKMAIKKLVTPQQLSTMKKEVVELEALKIASENVNKIHEHIDYLNKYDKMIKSLNTVSISKMGTDIVTNFLGEKFKSAFSTQLEQLGGKDIPLQIGQSTRKAKPTFNLELEDASIPRGHKLDSILSEGEQKVAALAGFLAEIETIEHRNGIILDDPVTSLDQKFRTRIAQRLVAEARRRQVIIFTHDLTFLFELQHLVEKEDSNVEIMVQKVRKIDKQSGVVDELGWHEKNVSCRINHLKQMRKKLEESGARGENYNNEAGHIYSLLRETWEKLIEEILFNKVVTRFRVDVQTTRLEEVTIKDEDYKTICSAMDHCSKYMAGHDTAPALLGDKPSIEQIKEDIGKIEKYKKDLADRMKEKRKDKKQKTPSSF